MSSNFALQSLRGGWRDDEHKCIPAGLACWGREHYCSALRMVKLSAHNRDNRLSLSSNFALQSLRGGWRDDEHKCIPAGLACWGREHHSTALRMVKLSVHKKSAPVSYARASSSSIIFGLLFVGITTFLLSHLVEYRPQYYPYYQQYI